MAEDTIVIPYYPRPQFVPYHERKQRFAKIVAHRRFGKTVGTINDTVRAALMNERSYPPPRYGYVAPTYAQAKDVAWGYLKHYTAPIPGLAISDSELWIDLPTGARVRLYGADNYDRMRGLYFDGLVVDEPAQINPRAWPEVMRPTLSDYRGWASFIGTPRGRDWFYQIGRLEDGTQDEEFFHLTLRASETGVLPPEELESARRMLSANQYEQEYECSFDAAITGAYFGDLLAQAQKDGRVGRVAADPLLPVRSFHDIGGSGAMADAYTIWIVQWVGQEIRVLDYYEAVGQVLASHVNWMRSRGWDKAIVYLPHDGVNENNITGKRYEEHWRDAGFKVEPPIKNQGRGAAALRVEAVRRLFGQMWFNEATTAPGRDALAFYHEKMDDKRSIGLGPDHDWSSHAADAFGLMAICYEDPGRKKAFSRKIEYPSLGVV